MHVFLLMPEPPLWQQLFIQTLILGGKKAHPLVLKGRTHRLTPAGRVHIVYASS